MFKRGGAGADQQRVGKTWRSTGLTILAILCLPVGVAAAEPLGEPEVWGEELVTVDEVITAREVAVRRADGTALRVRFPAATVPEGLTPTGAPVCGAAEARRVLAKFLTRGLKVNLEPSLRDPHTAWLDFPVPAKGESSPAQYAADGALYADLRAWDALPERYEGNVLEVLAERGWLQTGVRYERALADPTEVGFVDSDRFTTVESHEWDAFHDGRGVHRICGGDFRGAAAATTKSTIWGVSRGGKVKAVDGIRVRTGVTGTMLAAIWPDAVAMLDRNSCWLYSPERRATVFVLAASRNRGRDVAPPPRTPEACAARRVVQLDQHASAARVAGARVSPSLKRLQQLIPALGRSEHYGRYAQIGRGETGSRPRYLHVWLDRRLHATSVGVFWP